MAANGQASVREAEGIGIAKAILLDASFPPWTIRRSGISENGSQVPVIFVAGLGHSGSTFLELLLSSHPDVVGLGEIGLQVERLLLEDSDEIGKEICSCGIPWSECLFWGQLVAKPPPDRRSAYESIFSRFEDVFPSKIIADSSKGLRHLKTYDLVRPEHDVRVILIVRDYRGWALSRSRTDRKKGRFDAGYILNCYRWMFDNARLILSLSRTHEYASVSYEDLVFSRQAVLRSTFAWLDLSCDASNMENDPQAHNVLGNGMRLGFQKNRGIWYDHGWLANPRVVLSAPLVYPVHLYQLFQRWWLHRRQQKRQSLAEVPRGI